MCSNYVSNLKGIFLKFNVCQSKIDAVTVTQNTSTPTKMMKIAATLLRLFNTSYINPHPLPGAQYTIQAPDPTPDIYLGDS